LGTNASAEPVRLSTLARATAERLAELKELIEAETAELNRLVTVLDAEYDDAAAAEVQRRLADLVAEQDRLRRRRHSGPGDEHGRAGAALVTVGPVTS
jgi:hypothetical protein